MNAFLVSAGIVALGEIGDKTQLLAFMLATKFRKPIPIILGILASTILNHLLAGFVGEWVTTIVGPLFLRWILGISFIGMAIWTLIPDKIDERGISSSLKKLHLLGDDMYLRSQATNLGIVDKFITDIEYKVLHELNEMERTPPLTFFLSAQSQMWIFAAYELLRTWQQRAKEMVKWADNGGLEQKLAALMVREENDSYMHFGRENRIKQIESIINDPSLVLQIKDQLLHLHIPFVRLEYLRVSIAKHEVSGKEKSVARTPGYGRINSLCGSLEYDLENEYYSMGGYISRRDIADSIRCLDFSKAPPNTDTLRKFEEYMSGKGFEH